MPFTLLRCSLQHHWVVLELPLKLLLEAEKICSHCGISLAALCRLLLYSLGQMPIYKATHSCWYPVAGSHFEVAWEDTIKYSLVLQQASPYQRAFSCQPWFTDKGLPATSLQAAKPPFILAVLQSKDARLKGCKDLIGLSRPVRDKKTSKVKISL